MATPVADATTLQNLTSYRRSYGDVHRHDEEETIQSESNIVRAQFLSSEVVRQRLKDLQQQCNDGKLELFNCQGTFNPNSQCYEIKKKSTQYTPDNSNRKNRFIFKRLRVLISVLLEHMEEILEKNLPYCLSMTGLAYRVSVGYASVGSDESDTHDAESESDTHDAESESDTDEHSSRLAKKQKLDSDTGEHSSKPANKRKLNSSRFVPSDLSRICSTLECTRDSLWVNIRDAGYFAGDVKFVINNEGISGLEKSPGSTALRIPTKKLGTIKNIVFGNDITCILLIENYALFSALWDLEYHLIYKCILINLSGQPDYLVREFIYHISSADQSLPVFCLCDLDLGGYFIVEGLRFGTPGSAFMHHYSRCKSLQWMGIVPSDIERFHLQPDFYSDALFTNEERQKLNSHMAQFPHIPAHWKDELKKMANLPRKAKLQGKNILDKYLLPKLSDVAHWGER